MRSTIWIRWASAALFSLFAALASAESQVFALQSSQPQQILETIRSLYGDQLRAEVINQRLVVIGSAQQLADVAQLIDELDRGPAPLRLTLSSEAPAHEITGKVYRTETPQQQIDTVEGALIELSYSEVAQGVAGNGWWVEIEEVPTQIDSINLRIELMQRDTVRMTYSFVRYRDGVRQVFGNQLIGDIGRWLPLLPERQPPTPAKDAMQFSTEPAGSAQLYLKVDRIAR